MISWNTKFVLALVSLSLGLLVGCGVSNRSAPAATSNPAATASAASASEIDKNLAELSPEDQALARKQKVCPVSGEALGSMGKPDKIVVKGRTVFLCCSGCEEEVQKNPDKYLAKVDAAR